MVVACSIASCVLLIINKEYFGAYWAAMATIGIILLHKEREQRILIENQFREYAKTHSSKSK